MRTDEERIKAMHVRAAELSRQRKIQIVRTISVAACFVLAIGLAVFMSGLASGGLTDADPDALSASIFSGSKVMGYITIGVIAFALGVAATIFSYSLKTGKERSDREKRQ